jgi:phenylacetate-coenzyme A ligase PaaK-like adenylate-forming protein
MRRQKSRLAALLIHVREASPFYRHRYSSLHADCCALGDLPVVTKCELMAAFDDWVTDPGVTRSGVEAFIADPSLIATPYSRQFFVCTSAGTTGHPGIFVYDHNAIEVYRAITFARIGRAWFSAGDLLRMAQRGFRWAAVLGTGGHYVGAGWIELERQRDVLRSHAYRVFSVQQPLAKLVAGLNAFGPAMLTGYPSALELLAEEQAAGRLKLRPVLLECGGETLSQDARARIAVVFACPVRNMYAASECLPMAFSCGHNWLHVNSDWVILEPVDEDFHPTPPGELSHTVLLTNLANRIQPLIRYDLGDSVLVRPDPCPCGSPLPALRVAGRQDDVLRLESADGHSVRILPLAISAVVDETPGVHRSQLIQTGSTTIRVRLDLSAGVDGEKTWHNVIDNLSTYLAEQDLGNVSLLRASEPPEQRAPFGKFRQVIAQLPATGR